MRVHLQAPSPLLLITWSGHEDLKVRGLGGLEAPRVKVWGMEADQAGLQPLGPSAKVGWLHGSVLVLEEWAGKEDRLGPWRISGIPGVGLQARHQHELWRWRPGRARPRPERKAAWEGLPTAEPTLKGLTGVQCASENSINYPVLFGKSSYFFFKV